VSFRLRANKINQVPVIVRPAFYNALLPMAITRLVESVRLVIPQYCSTRAELVITHTMTSRLTVIRSRLSAWICQPFCCQRTLFSDSIGMPHVPRGLSGGTYPAALRCLAFQLCFSSFQKGRQKIKNPASSAGHSRFSLATLREARQNLARVARKVPHSRIY
jgi:hypothetical protein